MPLTLISIWFWWGSVEVADSDLEHPYEQMTSKRRPKDVDKTSTTFFSSSLVHLLDVMCSLGFDYVQLQSWT